MSRAYDYIQDGAAIYERSFAIIRAESELSRFAGVAERVVVRNPRSFLAQGLIGEYSATRDPKRTITAYEAYLQARPAELEKNDILPRVRLGFAYLARARLELRDGDEGDATADYRRAAEQLELVQRKFGKRANAQVNADNGLCAAYTGLGDFDRAIAVCERVSADPRKVDANGSVWFNLGVAYLAGELSLGEARERAVIATRRFARRQDSWFRKDPRITWIRYDDPDLVDSAVGVVEQRR